jgi:hypothetical protein
MVKKCTVCGIEKDETEFHFANKKTSRHGSCKKCMSKKQVAYQKEYFKRPRSKELLRERQKKYRRTKKFKDAIQRSREKYPEKRAANIIFSNAIATGKIERPSRCETCGVYCTPDGHHDDYSKPLDVVWMCKQCHKDYHMSCKP